MTSPIKYRPDIDGLRAVAVLAVVAHHFWPELLRGGYVGVDVFFVISGFLITKIIHKEISESRFSFVDFYDRRIRRIFPALFAMLGTTLAAGWFLMLPSDYLATFKASVGTLFFSANVVFWRQMAAGYFAATDASTNPLLHTWSLGVEEQFYIVFPFLLLFLARFWPRHQVKFLGAAAIVSLGLAQYFLASKSVAVFFLTPFRAWELLVGALLALRAVPEVKNHVMRESIAAAGLLAILIAAAAFDPQTPFPGLSALLPVLGTAAVIHAGSSGPAVAMRLITLRPMVYIGLISYSLYLWHWPVLVLGKLALAFGESEAHKIILLALSFALAMASYHFVEQPFRSKGVSRTRVFSYALAGSVALLAVSLMGWKSRGYPVRVDAVTHQYDVARAPAIPYQECDKKSQPCQIGADSGVPDSLFWGDSHMLAWAPGVDEAMSRMGRRGWLSIYSACPPLLGVDSVASPGCQEHNNRVIDLLAEHSEIRIVVLAAFWSAYVKPNALVADNDSLEGDFFSASMRLTVDRLQALGKTVVVIGPVPIYEASVPLRLALEHHRGFTTTRQDLKTYRAETKYFETALAFQHEVVVIDPGVWLCKPQCRQEANGRPLYRDSHHLSVLGAQTLTKYLYQEFSKAFTKAGSRQLATAASDPSELANGEAE